MTIIASIDGPNRDIYLHADTVDAEVHPIDIYKEMRALRRTTESLRNYTVFLSAYGNVPKGAGKATERYVVCNEGTRIIPYDASHQLTITGTIITDDGQEGIACFDRTGLTPGTVVDINYVPPQVEVITISSGSGLSPEQATMLLEMYKIQGLDNTAPMTVTPSSRVAGDVSLALTGDGVTSTTVTRT
jgi:hypothetical protein